MNRNLSSGAAVGADENVGRDAQLLAQPDDHGDGQGPVAVAFWEQGTLSSVSVGAMLRLPLTGRASRVGRAAQGHFGTTTPASPPSPSLRELRDLPHPCHARSLRSRPRRSLRRALARCAGRGNVAAARPGGRPSFRAPTGWVRVASETLAHRMTGLG